MSTPDRRTMGGTAPLSRWPLRLLVSLASWALLAAARPGGAESRLRLVVVGDPVEVVGGRVVELAARPTGAFAAAIERDYFNGVVRAFDADGNIEFVRSLRSLGYSGGDNIHGLVALHGGGYGIGWDVDSHYSGIQSSSVALLGRTDVKRVIDRSRRLISPAVASDSTGGLTAVALYTSDGGLVLRSWSATGQLVQSSRIHLRGALPDRLWNFRGGFALVYWSPVEPYRRLVWFDRQGRLIEPPAPAPAGVVVTDGTLLVDLERDVSHVAVRFGAGPKDFGPSRTVLTMPEGRALIDAALAGDSSGRWVLAWVDCDHAYALDTCRLRLRPVDRRGQDLGPPLELDGAWVGVALTAIGPGRFLVAAEQVSSSNAEVLSRVWRVQLTEEPLAKRPVQPGGRP